MRTQPGTVIEESHLVCQFFLAMILQLFQVTLLALYNWKFLFFLIMCMGGLPWWIIDEVFTACKLGAHLVLSSNFIDNLFWYLRPIQLDQSFYAVQWSCARKQQRLYRHHTKFKGCRQISNQSRTQPSRYPRPKKIRLNKWESPVSIPTKLDAVDNAGLVNECVNNHSPSDIMKFYNVFCDNDGSYKNIKDISSAQKVVKAKQSHTVVQDEMEIVPTHTSWVSRLQNCLTTAENRLYVSRIKLPQCFIGEMASNTVIIDSGASVCISLHCTNLITYGPSNMIKDLSSSNKLQEKDWSDGNFIIPQGIQLLLTSQDIT